MLKSLDAGFALTGPRTDFKVAGTYDEAPLALDGAVLRSGDGLEITLARFSAAPRKLPVALARPAVIRIAKGTTDLGQLSLTVAGGSIDVSGTISDSLDLNVDAPAFNRGYPDIRVVCSPNMLVWRRRLPRVRVVSRDSWTRLGRRAFDRPLTSERALQRSDNE